MKNIRDIQDITRLQQLSFANAKEKLSCDQETFVNFSFFYGRSH
jgi:hypothetical protein